MEYHHSDVNDILSDIKSSNLIYLSHDAFITLGTGSDPIYSRFENWDTTFRLIKSILPSQPIKIQKAQPSWSFAGALFAEICIRLCKEFEGKAVLELPEAIRRGSDFVSPNYPHLYLGYARRCFNSGLLEAGSHACVSIDSEDWMNIQTTYSYPIRNGDWSLCQSIAERIQQEGCDLLQAPPLEPGDSSTKAFRLADQLCN